MPRHLALALARLAELPRRDAPYTRLDMALDLYLDALSALPRLGIEDAVPHLAAVAQLWRERPDLRRVLDCFVLHHPHAALQRPMLRRVAAGETPDFVAWLDFAPDLEPELARVISARAKQFNQPEAALWSGIDWARYFDGGDEAWRNIALAIKRQDHRSAPLHPIRFQIEMGAIGSEELARLNRQLEALGQDPIVPPMPLGSWHRPDVDSRRADWSNGQRLAILAHSEHQFAGTAWNELDEADYVRRLATLDPAAQPTFDTYEPQSELLRRIRARARR